MRYGIIALSLLGMSLFSSPGHADPYLWCSVRGTGEQICYFKTLEQCRAFTLASGACSPNLSYDRRDARGFGRRHHALRY